MSILYLISFLIILYFIIENYKISKKLILLEQKNRSSLKE